MDLTQILNDHGLAVVIIFALFMGIAWFGKWFLHTYTHKLDSNNSEMLREIAEVKEEVLQSNMRNFSIIEKLISNQREIGEDINALESSLDTLLKYIKADK